MIVIPAPQGRYPGERAQAWLDRVLLRLLEGTPEWAAYPRALLARSALPPRDEHRSDWRLVGGAVVIGKGKAKEQQEKP